LVSSKLLAGIDDQAHPSPARFLCTLLIQSLEGESRKGLSLVVDHAPIVLRTVGELQFVVLVGLEHRLPVTFKIDFEFDQDWLLTSVVEQIGAHIPLVTQTRCHIRSQLKG
jgi:hypothetical protein